MITEGHLSRHYQGRKGGRTPALIDIAQDHALALISQAGVFELGAVLKGGTALRKYRAGTGTKPLGPGQSRSRHFGGGWCAGAGDVR